MIEVRRLAKTEGVIAHLLSPQLYPQLAHGSSPKAILGITDTCPPQERLVIFECPGAVREWPPVPVRACPLLHHMLPVPQCSSCPSLVSPASYLDG